ncbi:MAG: hemin uptake protein HemP [Pararhizobium sp.]|nr:hemin uptake protein HemP [Pararhizobium sp.]
MQDINANSEGSGGNTQLPQNRVLESKDLFKGGNEILIKHEGSVYRMKITRQGKLILNK